MNWIARIGILGAAVLLGWGLFVSSLHHKAVEGDKDTILHIALTEARIAFQKDITYRRWISTVGGVYAESSAQLPPNKYLDVPNRDITAPDGRNLTLVNPAYMTRMVHSLMSEKDGSRGHITSLVPIRPENAPDPWEAGALKSFERGEPEAAEVIDDNGTKVFRFMRPMRTEASCLRCHARQGYKEGDIRGGISVTIPMSQFDAVLQESVSATTNRYVSIFLVGSGFIAVILLILANQERIRNKAAAAQAEAFDRLKQSEERFRALFERAPVGIMLLDAAGEVKACNARIATLFGAEPHRYIGLNLQTRLQDPLFRQSLDRLFRDGETFVEGNYTSIITGRNLYLRLHGVRVAPDVFIAMMEDVTERKRAEEELRASKALAESASRSKSEFLANMSHEIRTPLNGVMGMLQLLEATVATDEQQDFIGKALQSTRRLSRLLSDILDISKIEAGQLRLVESAFSLSETRDAVHEIFSFEAHSKGLRLSFDCDPEIPQRLIGDEARLRQILLNLIGNAIKFTETGEVRIEMSRLPVSGPDRVRILFTVSDTGIGIPEESLGAIFEPFVQMEGSYTKRFQGAGLGLAIVRRLVTMMGGSISIDSVVGAGTQFFVSLPFGTEPPVTRCTEAEPREAREIPTGKLRVLIAEDDPVSLFSGTKLLEKAGHEVVTARNGEEALQCLMRQDFDIILMDIQMPVMDGAEATKAIRSARCLGAKSRIPVFAMTAYAMTGDREKFLAAGMDGYISKPFDMKELQKMIDSIMTCRQSVQS